MARKIYRQIIALVTRAADLARTVGIHNLLQPGLVKEMIIADLLGHTLIPTKRDADACDSKDPSLLYEYLTCKEGGSGQLDRMFKHPPLKRQESLKRITRNHKIYLAIFHKTNQTKIKTIYELSPNSVLKEAQRQLDRSTNPISHLSFPEPWAKHHGKTVYPPPPPNPTSTT